MGNRGETAAETEEAGMYVCGSRDKAVKQYGLCRWML